MIEWISESFNLLFSGISQLIAAAIRLGIFALVIVVAWSLISATIKEPVPMIRGFLSLVALFGIGIGSIIIIPRYVDVPILLIWVCGWIAAYYAAKFIGRWQDKKPNEQNNQVGENRVAH